MAVVKLCPDDSDFDSSVKHCRLQMHWEEQIDATAMYWTPDDTKIVQQWNMRRRDKCQIPQLGTKCEELVYAYQSPLFLISRR